MSHSAIGHELSPMWDGSNAPELHRGPQLPDGLQPEPGQVEAKKHPPGTEQLYCGYCDKLRVPGVQHACTQTVHMLYNPGTVVLVEPGIWALILETTPEGLIRYQRFTSVRTDFEEEPIADFHYTVTGDPVTP